MIIDLSKYSTVTDWQKVKNSVAGVILRCGYRGYGSGKIVEDAKFGEFAIACKKHGIPFGLFFMSQAINAAEGRGEAEFSLEKARKYGASLPIFIDSEDGDGTAKVVRADGLSKTQRTEVVKAFCDTVIGAGSKTGVYASESWYQDNLYYGRLKDHYLIWVAKYGKNNGEKSTKINLDVCHMHQYTSKGTVPGINGHVDLNDGNLISFCTDNQQNVQAAEMSPIHIQLNYQPGRFYTIPVDGLRIRTKKASQDPLMLPNADIIGTIPKGTKVRNQATARVGDQIWMYIGLDQKGREQWICADNGEKSYIK